MSLTACRIGLDLRPTEAGFKAHAGRGTGRYVQELVARLFAQDPDKTGFGFVPLGSADLWAGSWEAKLLDKLPAGKQTVGTQVMLPRRLQSLGLDMMHFFAHGDAPARRCMASKAVPQIVTVLDLIPLKFPHLYRASKSNWRFKLARYVELEAIRRSVGVLAISEATKRDVVELLGVRPERVFVTPLAVGDVFAARPLTDFRASMVAKRSEIAGLQDINPQADVILYVGGIDPRKNVPFLLKVFAELLRLRDYVNPPVLAIAGKIDSDDQYPKLLQTIAELGLTDQVRLLGFVSDEELVSLYQGASVLAFPSLYEGFGFPVLEAMACGCPVVAARNSSIPEVTGRAAMLIADNDTDGWVRALDTFLRSGEMQQEYSLRGINRADEFSWERTAELTLAAYRQSYDRVIGMCARSQMPVPDEDLLSDDTPLRAALDDEAHRNIANAK